MQIQVAQDWLITFVAKGDNLEIYCSLIGVQVGLRGGSTVLIEEADGSVVVRIIIESLDAAISYALSLGADATVLQPASIRDAVAVTAQAITEKYGAMEG